MVGFPLRGGTTRIEIMMKKKVQLKSTIEKYSWELQLGNTVEDDDLLSTWWCSNQNKDHDLKKKILGLTAMILNV